MIDSLWLLLYLPVAFGLGLCIGRSHEWGRLSREWMLISKEWQDLRLRGQSLRDREDNRGR